MLGAWLDTRQAYADFWDMTPAEVLLIVNAAHKRDLQDHEAARVRNFELANLTAFAHHDPKKMPEYKAMGTKADNALLSDEAEQARARGAFIALALASQR